MAAVLFPQPFPLVAHKVEHLIGRRVLLRKHAAVVFRLLLETIFDPGDVLEVAVLAGLFVVLCFLLVVCCVCNGPRRRHSRGAAGHDKTGCAKAALGAHHRRKRDGDDHGKGRADGENQRLLLERLLRWASLDHSLRRIQLPELSRRALEILLFVFVLALIVCDLRNLHRREPIYLDAAARMIDRQQRPEANHLEPHNINDITIPHGHFALDHPAVQKGPVHAAQIGDIREASFKADLRVALRDVFVAVRDVREVRASDHKRRNRLALHDILGKARCVFIRFVDLQ